jgi:hypothetical protein
MNIDERVSPVCASSAIFSDLFNFFYFPLFNIWRDGNFLLGNLRGNSPITKEAVGGKGKKKLLRSISGVCLGGKTYAIRELAAANEARKKRY